ncbi:DUF6069 family protein [Nocardiopsis exhalans]|uniref:DUF6069 family protein n=1 Tax=Nocardiopsis exhalans TaxID=163604 RepID=A0ABY5D4J8_9ACTN|nr:DUF6069 family protein [Nocardiopsis exhalans]USY18117.1 DUF6069 family protein [Nocardiopsis exhalans]
MTDTRVETRPAIRPSWQPRLVAVVAVAVVNALLALLAPLLGADLVVAAPGEDPMTLTLVDFALFSAGFALLGWGVLALAERLLGAGRGRLVWTVAAVLALLVMFVPPLLTDASVATIVVLELSHLVVAAVIPVFWKTSRAT